MTDLLKAVRIEIDDTDESPGVLPGKRHFADDQILYAADYENVTELNDPTARDVGRTAARCLELASVAHSSQPEEVELGPSVEKGKMSLRLKKQASILRAIWSYGNLADGRIPGHTKPPSYVGVGASILPPGVG